jgi:hypothetical protein
MDFREPSIITNKQEEIGFSSLFASHSTRHHSATQSTAAHRAR